MSRYGERAEYAPLAPVYLGAVRLPEPDEALAARAVTDGRAMEELYLRYVHRIYNYCSRRLHDDDAVRDATSAILLKAFENLGRTRIDKFESWIFSIAHNEICGVYRARRDTVGLECAARVPDPRIGLEDSVMATIDAHELRALIARLKPDQRDVVEMRLAGLAGGEIAQALGRSRAWVDTTQYRAVRRLRELMGSGEDA